MTGKIKTGLIAVAFFALGAATMISQQREIARLNDEAAAIRQSNAALDALIVMKHSQAGPISSLADLVKGSGRSQVDIAHDALRYVSSLQPGELAGALDGLKKAPSTYATNLVRALLLERWADENPADALAWVKTRDIQDNRSVDYSTLFQAWAVNDPAAALAGLKQVADPALQNYIVNDILGAMSLANPQGALDLLHQLAAGPANGGGSPIHFSRLGGRGSGGGVSSGFGVAGHRIAATSPGQFGGRLGPAGSAGRLGFCQWAARRTNPRRRPAGSLVKFIPARSPSRRRRAGHSATG